MASRKWETVFFKNHTQNVVEKLFPDLFLKNKSWLISGSIDIQFVFIVCQVGDYRNILKLTCRPLAFTLHKAFLKNKSRSGTRLPPSFSEWKIFLLLNSIAVPNFIVWFLLFSWDIGQCVYGNCLLIGLWRYKFRKKPQLSIQAVFGTWPKSQDKYLENERAFKMK